MSELFPMRLRGLQARFVLAGCLFAVTTIACGAWSVLTFAHLGSMVDSTVGESQETIDLAAALASSLEQEDDAVLLSLTGDVATAQRDRAEHQRVFEEAFVRIMPLMTEPEEKKAAAALREHADEYRRLGNALVDRAGAPGALENYHERVNPALRRATAACARIRELNFRSMQDAGIQARDVAHQATLIVGAIALISLVLTSIVSIRLARAIVRPIRDLTESVEAIRRDNFDHRVKVQSGDELGQLAEGFNRMAETLAEYRHSSLGELLLAKATLESALAAIPDPIFIVDPEGCIVSANTLAREILTTSSSSQPHHLDQLPLAPEDLRAVRTTLTGERPSRNRADLSRAMMVPLESGSRKMALAVAPIPEFLPKRYGAVIVFEDVTDFARLDELRSELVAVASHELKTPLTTVRMNLLLLQETAANFSARQHVILDAALAGGEELATTIDELLDLTRIEAGQLRLQAERVDVASVVDQVVRSVRPQFEDAEITLSFLKNGPDAVVHGDAARLRIVFANLLNNALKYTPRHGHVTIALSCGQNAAVDSHSILQIAVTDTGPGIPDEYREHVFEKFFRVEHHAPFGQDGLRGAGIGLYLCRQIIEAHGGSIACQTVEHGTGTRIAISLPRENT